MSNAHVKQLHAARCSILAIKAAQAKMLDEVMSSQEYQNLTQALEQAKVTEEEMHRAVSDDALDAFDATANKKPIPGTEIKMMTVLEYDKVIQREWCLRNFTPALTLDVKIFERAAKDGNIPGVVISQVPKVFIASDLSTVLDLPD